MATVTAMGAAHRRATHGSGHASMHRRRRHHDAVTTARPQARQLYSNTSAADTAQLQLGTRRQRTFFAALRHERKPA